MASLPFSSTPFRPSGMPTPLTASMQAPSPMPSPFSQALPPPHRDEASFNARLFAVLNSLEQRNEKRPEASVPTYVKWGLPFLVVSQVATLALLAFNMNEMSALKSCQSSMENTVDRIEKDLLKKASFQDILVGAQELISGPTTTNPDLQPIKGVSQSITPKELSQLASRAVNIIKGLAIFGKKVNSLCQKPVKFFKKTIFWGGN
jgi:hypothetical protein